MSNKFGTTTDASGVPMIIKNGTHITEYSYKEDYERDLKKKQKEHLDRVQQNHPMEWVESPEIPWQPCMHDQCSECHGTGIKHDGSMCVHMISCPCPKCSTICTC